MERLTLPALCQLRGFLTDKDDLAHQFRNWSYLDVYETLFATMRDMEFTLVEIGVLNGGSLRLWQEYFPKATIVGVDIDPDTAKNVPDGAKFIHASQIDEVKIKSALVGLPPLGVVIDDGSHYVPHMLASFRFLYPMVIDGGVYVMEDTGVAYDAAGKDWPGNHYNPEPSLKNNREDLDRFVLDLIKAMDNKTGDVRSIEFHCMMIAIRKTGWAKPTLNPARRWGTP